jgi:hypothetical protein
MKMFTRNSRNAEHEQTRLHYVRALTSYAPLKNKCKSSQSPSMISFIDNVIRHSILKLSCGPVLWHQILRFKMALSKSSNTYGRTSWEDSVILYYFDSLISD